MDFSSAKKVADNSNRHYIIREISKELNICLFPSTQKENIKKEIRDLLSPEQEITKIIIFGSFINSNSPRDIDIAVFQDSNQKYMPLSLKYRRLTRKIAKILPLDVIPIKANADNIFINEIESGEIIYER